MLEYTENETYTKSRKGWVINIVVLLLSAVMVALALKETGGVWTIWTVLLALGGISALLVTGMLVVAWFGGHAKPPSETTIAGRNG